MSAIFASSPVRKFLPRVVFLLLLGCTRTGFGSDSEQRYSLQSKPEQGDTTKISAKIEVHGSARFPTPAGPKELPLKVDGALSWTDRCLSEDSEEPAFARRYLSASATLTVGEQESKRTLRNERMLMRVEATDAAIERCAIDGRLTRDELDLVKLPGDALLLGRLLPSEKVAVGDSWKPELPWAAFLAMDRVEESAVECKLVEVPGDYAIIDYSGKVTGVADGVETKLSIRGKFRFDFRPAAITKFGLIVDEKRPVSPIGPGLDVSARLELTLTRDEPGEELSNRELELVSKSPTKEQLLLEHEIGSGRYGFSYSDRWHAVGEQPEMAVLRLVDESGLVSQCSFMTAKTTSAKETPTMEAFREDIKNTLGEGFGKFLDSKVSRHKLGYSQYRVVAQAKVDNVDVRWHYYLIFNSEGHGVVVAFTYEADAAKRFGASDEQIVASLRLTPERAKSELAPEQAARPEPTSAK